MLDDHLGTHGEITDFAHEMKHQLELHSDQEGLRNKSYDEVKKICVKDLERRLQLIKDGDKRTVEKQSVHSGNYLLFLFLKAREA